MKNHVYRPLFVVIIVITLILAARTVYVPKDFGVGDRGYMYGWHRQANEEEWKKFEAKFRGREYCKECHDDNYTKIMTTPHLNIQCENCHGPAIGHPEEPPKLAVDRTRAQCLRCHLPLPYLASGRSHIVGVDPDQHHPGSDCSDCHNPHDPMEGVQ